MLREILKLEAIMPLRRHQVTAILAATIAISAIAVALPQRTDSTAKIILEGFQATHILMALGFALIVVIPGISKNGFPWGSSRLGPLPAGAGRIVTMLSAGQFLVFMASSACLCGTQIVMLAVAKEEGANILLQSLPALWAIGACILAWSRLLGATLPPAAAMLASVGIVVASQFLLLSHKGDGASFWGRLSPGVEFALPAMGRADSTSMMFWSLCLALATTTACNLLSAWALEARSGGLSLLDPPSPRS